MTNKSDLISREALNFDLRQQLAYHKEKAKLTTINNDKMAYSLVATGIQLALDIIDNAPAVSATAIATIGYEAAKKKYENEPIRCRECKHQVKEFRADKRMKNGGYWISGCKMFGEICGYWAWGGNDDQFCSDAEQKGGVE